MAWKERYRSYKRVIFSLDICQNVWSSSSNVFVSLTHLSCRKWPEAVAVSTLCDSMDLRRKTENSRVVCVCRSWQFSSGRADTPRGPWSSCGPTETRSRGTRERCGGLWNGGHGVKNHRKAHCAGQKHQSKWLGTKQTSRRKYKNRATCMLAFLFILCQKGVDFWSVSEGEFLGHWDRCCQLRFHFRLRTEETALMWWLDWPVSRYSCWQGQTLGESANSRGCCSVQNRALQPDGAGMLLKVEITGRLYTCDRWLGIICAKPCHVRGLHEIWSARLRIQVCSHLLCELPRLWFLK